MEEHRQDLDREPEKEQEPHWTGKVDNRKARRRRAALDRRGEK